MKLKIKKIKIQTGDTLVAVINRSDSQFLDLYQGDRIKIINKKNENVTAFLDIADSDDIVPKGSIGIFQETNDNFNIKSNEEVTIIAQKKPDSIAYIKKKLAGKRLNYEEFYAIIDDISHNRLSHIEITYFVSGCYSNELNNKETVALTKAMINTGESLDFGNQLVLDKHCIGGVAGNRTTMIVVPIIAAAGYLMPKTSSRSITSAAGTADTVEVLCNVSFPIKEMKKIITKTNSCLIWGGALNLAPSDDKIIKVESPISLDPTGQLLASILAKKKSVGANTLLIDIPIGRGAKIENINEAKILKSKFKKIASALRMKTDVLITDGSSPVGNGIGPALEARDVLWTLSNNPQGCQDLKEKSIYLAGKLLKLAGERNGMKLAKEILESGKAYEKFIEIVKAQGGKEIDPSKIKIGKNLLDIRSQVSGEVTFINNKFINRIARIAGAPTDKGAGLYLHIKKGDIVTKGQKLFTIYSESLEKIDYANEHMKKSFGIEIKNK